MSLGVSIGDGTGKGLDPHPLRAAVLGEVHARPFTAIATPARILLFAFQTGNESAQADRAVLEALCSARGCNPPKASERHHRVSFGATTLRWEQHSEFTTYTWELPADPGAAPFHPAATMLASPMGQIAQPGPLLVATDLHLVAENGERTAPERLFDRASLAAAENSDGTALYATDFQPDPAGFVRILVVDCGLGAERAGALVQRVLEIETYRIFALLGLPEAQRLAPAVRRIERRLAEVTEEMRKAEALADNRHLLDELTALAAELEAGAVGSLYRFGASRAYNEIVHLRLNTIGERKVGGLPTWTAFLARRMSPAVRTCVTTEERQANLSRKLARAANLLRTRVDVALEQQNQDLLMAMNARTRMQLRLQATVEGLSVAAITYYVVGLFGYLVKGAHDSQWLHAEPSLLTGLFVPLAALAIWYVVRRVRKRHVDPGE
ncbi:MAG: DUF3422 family protein [Pseudorhodoplanes sp.]|nr:hypothetical protein [Pseudorhodoplanes sp.]MBW7948939.1 DUF3422 domain-containing protein [Pseudorhodoplanes sp.]MCL4710659.1 DUF3422 family protein [Pseudorhodoplanes sp.]GIK81998.1 MAG: membrane protein [Alphaproteobacteria bacterium]